MIEKLKMKSTPFSDKFYVKLNEIIDHINEMSANVGPVVCWNCRRYPDPVTEVINLMGRSGFYLKCSCGQSSPISATSGEAMDNWNRQNIGSY